MDPAMLATEYDVRSGPSANTGLGPPGEPYYSSSIQRMLDENNHLIQCILDYQSKGKTSECSQYQQMLHRNLVYLATLADSSQNSQSLLPTLPNQSLGMGAGGGLPPGGAPHSQSLPPEPAPPPPHMQGPMSNGHMAGPNSMAMQPPNHQASPALSLPASSHATMAGYSHSVPSSGPGGPSQAYRTPPASQGQGHMVSQQPAPSQYNLAQGSGQHYQGMMGGGAGQGSQMMGQRQMPGYSRSAQQGPPQQFGSQDDYYAEQYSHGQPPADGMTPQYYPDGTGQYGQQQGSYQPGPPAQTYPSQQQFGGPQGYPSQGQGYGPAQTASGQYAGYPQGQQYGAYRPPQPGPPTPQQQRPYGYEQGQYGAYQQ